MENTPTEGPTPGLDPVITLNLGSTQLRVRRPSRGDESEIKRRYVQKLLAAAPPIADSALMDLARLTLDRYDGANLYAEAQFEVLLMPRRYVGGEESLGESAPDHWFRSIFGVDKQPIGRVVSFDRVATGEFDRAAEMFRAALEEKKSGGGSERLTSIDTAQTPSSG